jgi:hypothetical protein
MNVPRYGRRVADFLLGLFNRLEDLLVALIALAMGALFLYWGGHGLIGLSAGIREASTEPWVCLLGLVGGSWMLLMAVRLFRGPGPHRRTLLSHAELLVLSLVVVTGSLWTISVASRQGIAFLGIGLAGLAAWWAVRPSRRKTRGPAA